jgi:hypothetical protein
MQQLLDDVAIKVKFLYREAVDPLADRFAFGKRPDEGEIAGAPTVLILGNHSSGKSTFINHLLGGPIQKTGLAPTDDAFTVLSFGSTEEERDGQAVVSTPNLPYGGLRNFGPQFLSHFRLKLRPVPMLREVQLIDSPGMIDSPGEGSGRGFDFTGAVRWFAERADVVLVFFDPEKPGTTGETLQVFTQALQGMDHKLLIVLNKMDQFQSLQDFARAYGALCWNLGKVIPRKDLPLIFTTFVPVDGVAPPKLPTQDFVTAREELIREIKRAPARRLLVHAKVIDEAGRRLRRFRVKLWSILVVAVLVAGLAGAITIATHQLWWISAIVFGSAALLAYAGSFVIRGLVRSQGEQIIDGLGGIFEHLYARELLVRDQVDDLHALWAKVQPRVRQALSKVGILAFPSLSRSERERLSDTLEKEVPELRRKLHRELGSASRA